MWLILFDLAQKNHLQNLSKHLGIGILFPNRNFHQQQESQDPFQIHPKLQKMDQKPQQKLDYGPPRHLPHPRWAVQAAQAPPWSSHGQKPKPGKLLSENLVDLVAFTPHDLSKFVLKPLVTWGTPIFGEPLLESWISLYPISFESKEWPPKCPPIKHPTQPSLSLRSRSAANPTCFEPKSRLDQRRINFNYLRDLESASWAKIWPASRDAKPMWLSRAISVCAAIPCIFAIFHGMFSHEVIHVQLLPSQQNASKWVVEDFTLF